ncbi:hypothetical protein [Roseomonas indoligenes]|uniref:Uncharacterized protein n=1 Tax=Roseomonas indoligenes TaxID=2820811 RepID=A0A940MWN4_9PROT|nr:hypothetical protein [Pararoseomonas indoligenes]MBP0492189.1 hypothetical protein [Pararoseomonas indoligenes]
MTPHRDTWLVVQPPSAAQGVIGPVTADGAASLIAHQREAGHAFRDRSRIVGLWRVKEVRG